MDSVQRLLLVEDDADQREILEMLFRAAGFDVIGASDGPSALNVIADQTVHIVVCDLMMPGMSGEMFIEELRRTPGCRRIPVLMLTAVVSEEKEKAALEKGANAYCAKDVQPKVLLQRVQKLLSI